MHDPTISNFLVIMAVLLFFALGVAILIIMDHKSRMPGGFKRDLFTISGMRRDHPFTAFITMSILAGIIAALILSLLAAVLGKFDVIGPKEEPELLKKISEERMVERTRHFHNEPKQRVADLGKKNVCFFCHGDYPHSKEPMIRTLMNMHTQFISCMTCHVDAEKIPEEKLAFKWLNYSGIEVKGEPFGIDVNPKSGLLDATDDYYSKIVPYNVEGGEQGLLEMPEDSSAVQEFIAVRDKLDDRDREAIKNRFHKMVSAKGRFCSRCHTDEDESYLPFRKLGFSERRVGELTNLNIIGLVKKYKKFYMPNLLDGDKTWPVVENSTGKKEKSIGTPDKMKKDPRAWWRETYDAPSEKSLR